MLALALHLARALAASVMLTLGVGLIHVLVQAQALAWPLLGFTALCALASGVALVPVDFKGLWASLRLWLGVRA